MSSNTWTPRAVSSEAADWSAIAWRMVEAQHTASTMKLVDSLAEQQLLESLLESAKPALPEACAALDYLLATPFRYPSRRGGSRFRRSIDPGVFYGAGAVRTACAELGYWRWRFLRDAPDLERLEPVAHTAFRTRLRTEAIDLRVAPLSEDAARWTDPIDYSASQLLAHSCREAGIGAIIYTSVRDPEPGWCVAVLEATAFVRPKPLAGSQTWWLAVTPDGATWRRDDHSLTVDMRRWNQSLESE